MKAFFWAAPKTRVFPRHWQLRILGDLLNFGGLHLSPYQQVPISQPISLWIPQSSWDSLQKCQPSLVLAHINERHTITEACVSLEDNRFPYWTLQSKCLSHFGHIAHMTTIWHLRIGHDVAMMWLYIYDHTIMTILKTLDIPIWPTIWAGNSHFFCSYDQQFGRIYVQINM